MIKHKKLIFTVDVAMKDAPIFRNEVKAIEEIKNQMYFHLQQLYPLQMLVDGNEKLELLNSEQLELLESEK